MINFFAYVFFALAICASSLIVISICLSATIGILAIGYQIGEWLYHKLSNHFKG